MDEELKEDEYETYLPETCEDEPLKVQQRMKVYGPVTNYNGYSNYSGDD